MPDKLWPEDHPGIIIQTADGWRAIPLWSCPEFLQAEDEETLETEDGNGNLRPEEDIDVLWPDDHPGEVIQAIDGFMLAPFWACPPADSPCGPDPEMLLTVTGASGTINWCGVTWNLPAESGVEKSACPTFYVKERGNSQTPSYYAYYSIFYRYARHRWSVPGGTGLQLGLNYNVDDYTPPATNYWRMQYASSRNYLRLRVLNESDYIRFYAARPQTEPVMATTTITAGSDIGAITIEPNATYNSYNFGPAWFGAHVIGGITYAWAQGEGW